jgi:hypothetical protein
MYQKQSIKKINSYCTKLPDLLLYSIINLIFKDRVHRSVLKFHLSFLLEGPKLEGAPRQMVTLTVEARKRRILIEGFRGYSYSLGHKIIWKHETFNIRSKAQQCFRELKTGRYIRTSVNIFSFLPPLRRFVFVFFFATD